MTTCDRTVVVSHDQEADAAYVQFPGFEGETYPTQIVVEDDRLESMIVLDFTASGQLAGVEVVGVSPVLDDRMLPPS
ncbi:DUF2283 domain-containing protein [Aeromicrobium sp. P5_D10]